MRNTFSHIWIAMLLVGGLFALIPTASAVDNTVVRTLPSAATCGSEFTVLLAVDVAPGGTVWGIDESAPAGWTVVEVNQGGSDATPGHAKWIVFGAPQDEIVTYLVRVPAGFSGTATFTGIANFGSGDISIPSSDIPITCGVTGTVSRSMPQTVACGKTLTVTMAVDTGAAGNYWGVEEDYPADWSFVGATGGASGATPGKIKKLAFSTDADPLPDTSFTYKVKVPAGTQGLFIFTGIYAMTGIPADETRPILGDAALVVTCVSSPGVNRDLPPSAVCGATITVEIFMDLPADTTAVAFEEHVPEGWTVVPGSATSPASVTDPEQVRLAILDGAGIEDFSITYRVTIPEDASGSYAFTGQFFLDGGPIKTIRNDLTIRIACGVAKENTVLRVVPPTVDCEKGDTVTILLLVNVFDDALSWGVDEIPPAGLDVSAITGGGEQPPEASPHGGHIHWFEFSGSPSDPVEDARLYYDLTIPPDSKGPFRFDGTFITDAMTAEDDIFGATRMLCASGGGGGGGGGGGVTTTTTAPVPTPTTPTTTVVPPPPSTGGAPEAPSGGWPWWAWLLIVLIVGGGVTGAWLYNRKKA